MKRFILLFIVYVGVVGTAFAIDPIEFKDGKEEVRFQTLARELRCLVCQNENIADSTAGLAQDLRHDVISQMREGKTDAEIKDYMTSRYGDFILYSPPVKPRTWLLWFGPFVLLLGGAFLLTRIVRKRSSKAIVEPVEDPIKGDWQ
jgi:cytochrome c-type biogenesis protein CcmH